MNKNSSMQHNKHDQHKEPEMHEKHAGHEMPSQTMDHSTHEMPAQQTKNKGHDEHAGHGTDHSGHEIMFRTRFWWSLLLSTCAKTTSVF